MTEEGATFGRNALQEALDNQGKQYAAALKLVDDVDAQLQLRIKALRNKFDLLGDDVLRNLAEKQLAAEKAQAAATANTPPSVRNGSGNGPGGIGSGINVNVTLQALNPGDLSTTTIQDLARRLTAPLRTIIANGS